jgi:UDP-arabinose 4-epimerase
MFALATGSKKMKVLVTGGAGYIGSHACKALAMAGDEPIVYDDLSLGHHGAVKWGPCIVADLANDAAIEKALREHRVEAVMHFAGSSCVGESMGIPAHYFRNNLSGTATLLEAMSHVGVDKIVFSSTCAIYGLPDGNRPIKETHPSNPVNPYGESKLTVEKMLRWLGDLKGLRWMALRYFNAAGADPEGEIGEAHHPETHLIPLVLRAAAPGGYRLNIFGTDYETPDGTAIRDYVHVSDIADAHVSALRMLETQTMADVVNLGTGAGASVRQVIAAVSRTIGLEVRCTESPRRGGDPPVLIADASKARHILRWVPQRSTLETIITDAWRWDQKGTRDRWLANRRA